jgi:hypothetical protein
VKNVRVVCIKFPLQVYIDSNLRDSRIRVTAFQHVENYGMMVHDSLIELLYLNNCIATIVWLSSELSCLKSS